MQGVGRLHPKEPEKKSRRRQMRKLSFLSGVYPVLRRPRRGHGARRARHRRVRLAVAPPSTAPLHVL